MPQGVDVLKPSFSTRVFEIPELVQLIGGFAHKNDLATLLRSSRRIFASIAPILWEDIDLMSLMRLIPGLRTHKFNFNESAHQFIFRFPEEIDTSRFKLYDNFVRIVKTKGPCVFSPSQEWPSDVLSVPLLPNLQHLIVNTCAFTTKAEVDWIPKLLTPSLRSFEMQSIELKKHDGEDLSKPHPWLAQESCLELLDYMAMTCPHIGTLHIFPAPAPTPDATRDPAVLDRIATLKHLSVLALGAVDLDQELFEVLGQLPRLEVLSLHNDESRVTVGEQAEIWISDGWFPGLRVLEFRGIKDTAIRQIRNASSLSRRLERANIIFRDIEILDSLLFNNPRSRLAVHFFGVKCLHLVDLTLLTPRATAYLSLSFSEALNMLKQMPLRRLRLGRLLLRPWGSAENLNSDYRFSGGPGDLGLEWRDFLTAVPHLEELHLEAQRLRSSRLPLLASMLPNLQVLALLMIMFDRLGEHTGQPGTQSVSIQCTYYGDDMGSELPDFPGAARYVYSTWPNATFEKGISKSWIPSELHDRKLDGTIQMNNAIELLRANQA